MSQDDQLLLAPEAIASVDLDEVFRVRQLNLEAASARYRERREAGASGIVLVITSQHPLTPNPKTGVRDYPGFEYRARLDRGLELARGWLAENRPLTVITLGDVHRDNNGVADVCSLHESGVRYLLQAGLPAELLIDEAAIAQHSPDGVYCTEDEVSVAAGAYLADPRMLVVVAVCGQAQNLRVMLAAQNRQVSLQAHTPLVLDNDGALADPTTFHHEPAREVIQTAPLDVVFPVDTHPFHRVRDVVKRQRQE